jgi:hypothetical protein
MDTLLWTLAAAVAAAAAALALRPLVRTWRTYRGARVVTCPETGAPVGVTVNAACAVAGQLSTGRPVLTLAACSRWPERAGCGQQCLAQIENAPEDCLVRVLLARWYAGARCVFCRRPIGPIHWMGQKPALRAPDGAIRAWRDIRIEDLPRALETHWPVCSSCHVCEAFRQQHPEMVIDAPRAQAPPPS